MRFRKITIENFGPFKNKTSIDFGEYDGISIIWGRNGRGKTSLLNAFSFVLNNTVKDRDGKVDDFISFINLDGFKSGKYTYKVSLEIESNNDRYNIVRSLELLPTVEVPKSNSDVKTVVMVNSNGSILSEADANHFVNNLMTPEVSRFFLFDGELLTEYEELLNENSSTGGSIKKSIEQILGMPVLTYGAVDAGSAVSTIQTEARKVAQNDANIKKHAKALEEKQEDLETQIAEKDRLIAELEEKTRERSRLQNLAEDTEKIREYTTKRDEIEGKIENYRTQIETEKSEIAIILGDASSWMISSRVKEVLDSLKKELSALHDKDISSRDRISVVNYIEEAIRESRCPVCDHSVNDDEAKALEKKISEIKSGINGLTEDEKKALTEGQIRVAVLDRYQGSADRTDEVKRHYDRIVDATVRMSDLIEHDLKDIKNDLEALKSNATGIDEKKAFQYFDQLTDVQTEIKLLEQGIKAQGDVIDQIKADIKKLNDTIIAKSDNKDVALAGRKVDFATEVQKIFEEGIDLYRDKLSKKVEKDATEIFMSMNTEEDYGGLKINDNYGLSIVRNDGEIAPKRSAGWEHMVAFALIGALHKNAPFDGPVIMDSPFYRLDNVNTESMVKALPIIADQILMLPYPGEINETTTRRDIGTHIVQELKLKRISANESEIVKEMN